MHAPFYLRKCKLKFRFSNTKQQETLQLVKWNRTHFPFIMILENLLIGFNSFHFHNNTHWIDYWITHKKILWFWGIFKRIKKKNNYIKNLVNSISWIYYIFFLKILKMNLFWSPALSFFLSTFFRKYNNLKPF